MAVNIYAEAMTEQFKRKALLSFAVEMDDAAEKIQIALDAFIRHGFSRQEAIQFMIESIKTNQT